MSTTTVAELKAALGVGSLYPDATLQEVADAADNVMLPFLWKNDYPVIAQMASGTSGTLYFNDYIREAFYVGQSIVISNSGTRYNGTKTITSVGDYSISFAIAAGTDNPYSAIQPYGTAAITALVDYSTVPAIKQASLMICVSIWTSRQTNSGNGMMPDGSMGNMYSMSSQLISRVRGLLAPYLSPNSMVG